MKNKKNKRKRQALCDQQNGLCALCNQPFLDLKNSVYDKLHNTMTCRSCAMLIYANRDSVKRGVTFEILAAYEAQERADDPQY